MSNSCEPNTPFGIRNSYLIFLFRYLRSIEGQNFKRDEMKSETENVKKIEKEEGKISSVTCGIKIPNRAPPITIA